MSLSDAFWTNSVFMICVDDRAGADPRRPLPPFLWRSKKNLWDSSGLDYMLSNVGCLSVRLSVLRDVWSGRPDSPAYRLVRSFEFSDVFDDFKWSVLFYFRPVLVWFEIYFFIVEVWCCWIFASKFLVVTFPRESARLNWSLCSIISMINKLLKNLSTNLFCIK